QLGLVLQAAAAGIDQDRRAERARSIQRRKQVAVEDMPRLAGQRQQADQDVGLAQKRFESLLAVKATDARNVLRVAAPARYAKTEMFQRGRRIRAEIAE